MAKYTYKQLEKNKNRYSFEAQIEEESFKQKQEQLIKKLGSSVKVAGFRPGKAPKETIEKEVGGKALMEAINELLPEVASEIIMKENLNPLSRLEYDIKDAEKDISFTFTFLNQPEIDPSAIKKISVKFEAPTVKDEEIIDVIKNMARNSIPKEKLEKFKIESKEVAKTENEPKENEVQKDEHVGHNHEGQNDFDFEITEEIVQELGYEDEKTLDGLKAKVKETLVTLKGNTAEEQFAQKVIEEAIKICDFETPKEIIEEQAKRKEESFTSRISQIKLNLDDYLKTQNTSMEDLKAEWQKESDLEIRTDLILINYAAAEKLVPTDEDLDNEIKKANDPKYITHYKNERNREYLRTLMTRNNGLKKILEVVKENGK
jgi:trigger factor